MKLELNAQLSAHCESGATTNLLNFYKIDMNEPLAFGIGAGLFFGHLPFMKMNHMPVTTFRATPGYVFGRTCKYLGIDFFRSGFKDPEQAMIELDRVLDSGNPAGVQVGVYNLPFFPAEYRMHYNMHNMVVYGREGDKYFIADSVIPGEHVLTRDELKRVRYAKGAFAPKGKMYYVKSIPGKIDYQTAILKGLKKVIYENNVPFWMVGVKGIRFLSRQVRKWPVKLGDKMASRYLGMLILIQEEIGTGGCGYRYIFGAFMKEAYRITGDDKFIEFAKQTSEVAAKWREFSYQGARNCKERSGPEVTYDMLADILLEVADKEAKLFKDIKLHLRTQYNMK
jgi:hypothetical protein